MVPQSISPNEGLGDRPKFPDEEDGFSAWDKIGIDGTEAGDYNDEWNEERGGLWRETTEQKPSYKDMALASLSSNSNSGSGSGYGSVSGPVSVLGTGSGAGPRHGQLRSTSESDAGIVSLNSSTFGSESGATEKTDDLP